MNTKEDLQCSYCLRILKIPMSLPCVCENICYEHLAELRFANANQIKCSSCHKQFDLSEHDLKENKKLKSLIDKEAHLSDTEKDLKCLLEQSIKDKYEKLLDLEERKNEAILESHNHFQEIRRKIDLQREELKDEIDKISLAMIEQTKAIEASYKRLIENILPSDELQR